MQQQRWSWNLRAGSHQANVMDALSIVYPQFWFESCHENMLRCYMITLKATHSHPKIILSVPLVYETSPPILNVATLDQQPHWVVMAMVNNDENTMRELDLHAHP